MKPSPKVTLAVTSKERVLLHLKDMDIDPTSFYFPEEATQKGIGKSTLIEMSHVPRAIKSLLKEGLIAEKKAHVRSSPRKLKVYYLTNAGIKAAGEIAERIASQVVSSGDGELRVSDLYAASKKKGFWEFLRGLLTGETPPEDTGSKRGTPFFGREREVALIKKFIKTGPGDVLVIYGSRGVGKTSLIRHVLSSLNMRYVWVDIDSRTRVSDFLTRISAACPIDTSSVENVCLTLAKKAGLIVIDGYEEVRDELVDYLMHLIQNLRSSHLRMIVSAQSTTPSYSRFYHRDDVSSGRVREVTLSPLEPGKAKCILDPIPQEKFEMINKFAKGNPLVLNLIKAKDIDGLQKVTTFSREEIRHIIYLYES